MASSVSFNLSPTVLQWARSSIGFTVEEAAKKAGVSLEQYRAWESGDKLPTYKQLEGLAQNVFKRPLAILMLKAPPNEDPIQKDFRNLSNSQISNLSPEIRLSLRKAKRYQLILEEVAIQEGPGRYNSFKLNINDDPIEAANNFRKFLSFSLDEQKSWRYEDSLRNFQSKIESIGIYVFKLKMPIQEARAFCITGKFPIIVLNKEDSKNGRIFSLFHEVCHILLNDNDFFNDQESDKLDSDYKKIEEFCNTFSANFLVPHSNFMKDVFNLSFPENSITEFEIQQLARSYNVSNEVIARKLLSIGLISEDFFWTNKRRWDSLARLAKQQQNEKLKEGDGGRDQGIVIIYEKGIPYVSSVVNAFQFGKLSSSDLADYLETKLKNLPKIIQRLP